MNTCKIILRFLLFGIILFCSTTPACSVPVFRYALERWPSDAYEALILHPGPLTAPFKEAVDALDQFTQKNPINLSLQLLDTSQPLPKDLESLRQQATIASHGKPIVVLRFPPKFQRSEIIYNGPITSVLLQNVLHSAVRGELFRRIGNGETCVFLILGNENDTETTALKALTERQAHRLETLLKVPKIDTDDPESKVHSTIPLKIAFSTLVVNRNDPAEQGLVDLLLKGSDLKPEQNNQPLMIPVFGQGRLLDFWPASEVNEQAFNEIGRFLCGPCMCQYKEQNPGLDLLMLADWERILGGEKAAAVTIPDFAAILKDSPLVSQTVIETDVKVPLQPAVPVTSLSTFTSRGQLGILLTLMGFVTFLLKFSGKIKIIFGTGFIVGGLILLLPTHNVRATYESSSIDPHTHATSAPLMVYCAAGIREPVEKARIEYEKQYGIAIHLQYGGSGTLLNNLSIAKKGDLFLSADAELIAKAHTIGLVQEIIPLAQQYPVILTAHGNPRNITKLSDVTRPDVKWGFANPDAAAVGAATRRVLQKLGYWDRASKQAAVLKPTVNDIANDVKLGSIDAGIVWSTTAVAYPELETIHCGDLETQVEAIKIGVLSSSKQAERALHFARYLTAADRGLVSFKQLGYEIVDSDEWVENPELIIYSGALNRLPLEPVIREFEQREGVTIKAIYNGCGILTAQMKIDLDKKSFPDLYFACDNAFMEPVQKWFLPALNVSETDIVLLVAKGNPKNILSVQDLKRPGIKLGVGNCEQCTLGLLTKRFLTAAEGLYEQIRPNLRSEQPTADILINQMQTGSLDAVIVYRVNAEQVKEKLDSIPIIQKGALAVQPIAISKVSVHKQMSRRFIESLLSPKSRSRFEALGFRWRSGELNF